MGIGNGEIGAKSAREHASRALFRKLEACSCAFNRLSSRVGHFNRDGLRDMSAA